MNEHLTTWSTRPEWLARLLGLPVGEGAAADEPDRAKADLLRVRLEGTLPLEPPVIEALPMIVGRLRRGLLPLGGRGLRETLMDAHTPLKALEKVKAYGKRLAGDRARPAEHAVGVTVYFAAIAAALLNHQVKISSYSHARLADAFARLAAKPWMPPELVSRFAAARGRCLRRGR